MPRKKKEEISETLEVPETPMTRNDVNLESTPKPEVSEAPGLPRIIGGVCEFCGTGIDCIHYPELNGITE
jgi:hypothetical protein